MRTFQLLAMAFLGLHAASGRSDDLALEPAPSFIEVKAILVTADMELRPVAKPRFTACLLPECSQRRFGVTSFDGMLTLEV